jgi:hypothetical protein
MARKIRNSKTIYSLSITWVFLALFVLVMLYITDSRLEMAAAVVIAWIGGIISDRIYLRKQNAAV